VLLGAHYTTEGAYFLTGYEARLHGIETLLLISRHTSFSQAKVVNGRNYSFWVQEADESVVARGESPHYGYWDPKDTRQGDCDFAVCDGLDYRNLLRTTA
jgi:hypothetical protein